MAEGRATRAELGRRSLEGELQRLRLSLGEREAESHSSQERYDSLMKQVIVIITLPAHVGVGHQGASSPGGHLSVQLFK